MQLCGIEINCHNFQELITSIGNHELLVTVNAEAIVRAQKDLKLRNIINNSLTTIDGQIPLWLYNLKYGYQTAEKISGSELIYTLPDYANEHNLKVFLLGGKEESNYKSVQNLKLKYPKLLIKGYSPIYSPYPFPTEINDQIFHELKQFKPDFLFVGFGMGKQEFWAFDNLKSLRDLNIKLVIGCGGSFEFASGNIKRAPKIVQNIGMEGIWRLFKEFKWFRFKRLLLSSKIFYYYLKS